MSETSLSASDTLTPKEAAAILKLSADTVQRMIRTGKLKGIPVAGVQRKRYIVMRSDVAAYLEDRRFEVQADIEAGASAGYRAWRLSNARAVRRLAPQPVSRRLG